MQQLGDPPRQVRACTFTSEEHSPMSPAVQDIAEITELDSIAEPVPLWSSVSLPDSPPSPATGSPTSPKPPSCVGLRDSFRRINLQPWTVWFRDQALSLGKWSLRLV